MSDFAVVLFFSGHIKVVLSSLSTSVEVSAQKKTLRNTIRRREEQLKTDYDSQLPKMVGDHIMSFAGKVVLIVL